MKRMLALAIATAGSSLAHAADIEAGKARAATACAACHGADGVSVSDSIPNLAAQREGYLAAQLRALKDGTRKHAVMNAIAAQLSAEDIANVAAWFAAQKGAQSGAKSSFLPSLAAGRVAFPEGYRDSFVRYHTINCADRRRSAKGFIGVPIPPASPSSAALPATSPTTTA